MRKFKAMAIARAVAVIGATLALVTGVTFAALTSSTASVTNNTLATQNVSGALLVSGTGQNGSFQQSINGFTVNDYVPGTDRSVDFWLQNTSNVPMKVSVNIPITNNYTGFVNGGFSQVPVTVVNDDTNQTVINTNLLDLIQNQVNFADTLSGSATSHYTATINIPQSAVTGSQASITGFDINFTGTSTNP